MLLNGKVLHLCFSELQQFMVTYDKFMKWLEATLSTVMTRKETKHSVGVTESKLEEHKVSIQCSLRLEIYVVIICMLSKPVCPSVSMISFLRRCVCIK